MGSESGQQGSSPKCRDFDHHVLLLPLLLHPRAVQLVAWLLELALCRAVEGEWSRLSTQGSVLLPGTALMMHSAARQTDVLVALLMQLNERLGTWMHQRHDAHRSGMLQVAAGGAHQEVAVLQAGPRLQVICRGQQHTQTHTVSKTACPATSFGSLQHKSQRTYTCLPAINSSNSSGMSASQLQ